MYSEEKDLALRLKRKGWKCYFIPGAEIIHYGGRSTQQMPEEMFLELQRSQVKFFYTHYGRFYAQMLDLSWYLVLLASWLKSLAICIMPQNRHRARLMFMAIREYPRIKRPEAA